MASTKLLPILAASAFAVAAQAQTVVGSDGTTYMVLPYSQPQPQGSIYDAYQRARDSQAQTQLLQQQAELLRQQAALLQQQREQMEQQRDTPQVICVQGTPALPKTSCYQQIGSVLNPINQETPAEHSPVASPTARERKCSAGYQWADGSCQKIVAPQDGHLIATGTGWECNRGFHAIGNLCGPVYVPTNAELDASGHYWRCKAGFRRVADEACSPTGSTQ